MEGMQIEAIARYLQLGFHGKIRPTHRKGINLSTTTKESSDIPVRIDGGLLVKKIDRGLEGVQDYEIRSSSTEMYDIRIYASHRISISAVNRQEKAY